MKAGLIFAGFSLVFAGLVLGFVLCEMFARSKEKQRRTCGYLPTVVMGVRG